MKNVLFAAALIALSATAAQAVPITYTAVLSGGNEVPVVVTGSAGTAIVTWNTATKTGTYEVKVYNMPVATTQGHIHVGAIGAGGPVVVNFVIPGVGAISNDYGFSGSFGCTEVVPRAPQGINSCEDFEQALLLNNTYANVHSTNNPGGEIRGQLIKQ